MASVTSLTLLLTTEKRAAYQYRADLDVGVTLTLEVETSGREGAGRSYSNGKSSDDGETVNDCGDGDSSIGAKDSHVSTRNDNDDSRGAVISNDVDSSNDIGGSKRYDSSDRRCVSSSGGGGDSSGQRGCQLQEQRQWKLE